MKRKLKLDRQTIRTLSSVDLDDARGGQPATIDTWTNPAPSIRCPTQRSLCTLLSRCG